MHSIIADDAISDKDLLIEEIIITGTEGKLTVRFMLNGSNRIHLDYYDEESEMVGKDGEVWCLPV